MSISDIAAVLALALSAYAIWTTSRFNKRQLDLADSQEKLNALLLEQGHGQLLESKRADLGASIASVGKSSYRFKVWNRGKASARNVTVEFPEGNDIVDDTDLEDMFPLEILAPQQGVDLVALVHLGTKSKHVVVLRWADDAEESNEKRVYLTI